MASITLKFTSLAIRTLSKPIANYIKRQAREHPGFRSTCISFAQSLHRVDMRWRIGLLQDQAALERQAQRDAQKDAAKKKQASIPTVKTEAQTKADEEAASKAGDDGGDTEKHRLKPKVRPLSEAKAIETGANFISEAFIFSVAAGLILFETWRSRRKDANRRDVVKDRLDDLEESERAARQALIELEKEVLELRAQHPNIGKRPHHRILPKEVYEPTSNDNDTLDKTSNSWYARITTYIGSKEDTSPAVDKEAEQNQGPAAKILAESDRALDEKHKQQAAEDAAAEAATKSKRKLNRS